MALTTFGAIYIGSYEVSLKIFEINQRKQLKQVDYVRSRVELGKDAYAKGIIGYELVEELCQVLKEFRRIMDGYRVDAYEAYAGTVLRHIDNEFFILDQIKRRTKIQVQVLGNSEHRIIGFKSLAFSPSFDKMIQEGAAVVDVGGGNMQITLFWEGKALFTQQIVVGVMRIQEKLSSIVPKVAHYERQIQELIDKELEIFRKLYLEERKLKYVILMGDYIADIVRNLEHRREDDSIETERVVKTLKKLQKKDFPEMAQKLNLFDKDDPLLLPSVILYKRIAEELSADYVWVPGLDISDGIVYNYAQKKKMLKPIHSFDEDILSSAKALAERYRGYSKHTTAVMNMAVVLFDAMKNVHGMGKRERLLLQVACILHDCGRYVSLADQAECSYQIIMASEIIGMSQMEREIVASTVEYNLGPLESYEELMSRMDQESYMTVAKLAAFLKLSNAMDRSHKQKFKKVRATLKEKQLLITVETTETMVLEKGLFESYADFFERVFSIKPSIKEKRILNQE